ncbi:Na+/H+ antiporter NhaA [Flavobacterium caeni]|uniref:Na(+)/H(+) antiporter NhaA n=1 Tax=Flavobacterium caeni TaxID=490189 RepID=A0A1G5IT31_9FLAO|nr:Na+/H+ antiporter NhaA [Flavobacterium caeni]SCY79034.1 Na+:H+ antiporter, NhaA family [Flavobacterium caeni]
MRLTKLFHEFFESEKVGGLILIACTAVSLLLANSAWADSYIHFWHTDLGGKPIEFWINDGLMAIFFLLIGLELEREIYIGELSNFKNAALPIFAALGGMLVPAGIYLGLNFGTATQSGAGIPMATDIAFALGVLSLLGNRVPASLKVFLTALAVIDDLGAILVIAIFYTDSLSLPDLGLALGIFGALYFLGRLGVRNLIPFLVGGVALWYFMLQSGIHATISGVLLAFAIPFGKGGRKSTSFLLQSALHIPVSFVILPLFALANTAIVVDSGIGSLLDHSYTAGIALGLILGKPIGIWLFSKLSVVMGWARLPEDFGWSTICGVGFLGGIGFTMSIFITLLAFDDSEHIGHSKLVILISSLVAGLVGFVWLKKTLARKA